MYSIATIDFVQLDTAVTELHLKQINVPKYDKFNNVGVIESVKQGWIDMVFRRISLILGYVFQTEDEFEWTVCSTFSLAGDAAALFRTETVCHFDRLSVFIPVLFSWLHSRHIASHGEVWCLAVLVFFAVRLRCEQCEDCRRFDERKCGSFLSVSSIAFQHEGGENQLQDFR